MLPNLKLLITNYKLRNKGFTLIEMLVVIAIISILIGIGINTFTIAQQKARDVRRKADLRQLQTSLELFKQDKGRYPNTAEIGTNGGTYKDWGIGLVNLLVTQGYLGQAVVDPKNDTTYYYMYAPTAANGSGDGTVSPVYYVLRATLENKNDSDLQITSNTWHGMFWGNSGNNATHPICNDVYAGYCLMGGQ